MSKLLLTFASFAAATIVEDEVYPEYLHDYGKIQIDWKSIESKFHKTKEPSTLRPAKRQLAPEKNVEIIPPTTNFKDHNPRSKSSDTKTMIKFKLGILKNYYFSW